MKGVILRAGVWVIASVVVVGASTFVYTRDYPEPSPTPIASQPTPPSFVPPTLATSPQPTAEPTPEPTAEPTPLPTPVPPVIVSLPPLPTPTPPLPLPTLPPVPSASICLFPPSCGRSVPPRVCLPNIPPPCK